MSDATGPYPGYSPTPGTPGYPGGGTYTHHLPPGVTSQDLAGQIDWSDPKNPKLPGYRIAINPDGGITATKNNGFQDIGIPIIVGSIFALGLATGGAGFAGAGGGASSTTPLADLSGAPAFGSTDAGVIAGSAVPAAASTVGGATGWLDGLKKLATTPKGVATVAALIPTLTNLFGGNDGSNGNSPFGAGSPLMKSAQDSMDMANARTKEAGPIYDALINQAYGQTPTRYRGAAPAGYPAGGDAAPAGAYQFNAPQFGGK